MKIENSTDLKYTLTELMVGHMLYSRQPEARLARQIEALRLAVDQAVNTDRIANYDFLKTVWDEAFELASNEFRREWGIRYPHNEMGWAQVFETELPVPD